MQHTLQWACHRSKTSVALYCQEAIQNIAYYEWREFWMLAITASRHINDNVKVLKKPLPHCAKRGDPAEIGHATFKLLFQQNPRNVFDIAAGPWIVL